MGKFGKLWGQIGGSVIGIVFAVAATFGLAKCVGVGEAEVCTIFGISQMQVTLLLSTIFGMLGGSAGTVLATDSRVPVEERIYKSG